MKFERGPIREGQDENGNIKLFSEVRVIFEDESPEERSYIYQRYQQILREEFNKRLRERAFAREIFGFHKGDI